jgi:hypothetical protein
MKLNNDNTIRGTKIDDIQKIKIKYLLQHSNTQANLVEVFKQMRINSLSKIERESLSEWGRMIWI